MRFSSEVSMKFGRNSTTEKSAEFPPDTPAVVRHAFAPDLLRAPALAHGVDQLDAVGVDDTQHCWGGQEDLRPVVMRLEETKEPRALGEARKQRAIITRQPAIA